MSELTQLTAAIRITLQQFDAQMVAADRELATLHVLHSPIYAGYRSDPDEVLNDKADRTVQIDDACCKLLSWPGKKKAA